MKAGLVVRLRVNPKDCQSVLDLLDRVSIPHDNLSFSQCVSLALASLLETARTYKTLPEPDAFQYMNRMGKFYGRGHAMQGKRLAAANALGNIGEHFQAPQVSIEPARPSEPSPIAEVAEVTADEMRDRRRFAELYSKKDMIEAGHRGVLWSAEDEAEYNELYKKIYPEG